MITRICKRCKKELPETKEFFVENSNQSGKKWFSKYCRECYGFLCAKHHKKRRKKKICSKCKKEKNLSDFYKSNLSWCKECVKKNQKKINKKKLEYPPKELEYPPKKIRKSPKKLDEISLNGLNGDLKAIELYKGLSEKIYILMRKNRIEKYGLNARNIILDLMNACYKHLKKELKKEVIPVDWE